MVTMKILFCVEWMGSNGIEAGLKYLSRGPSTPTMSPLRIELGCLASTAPLLVVSFSFSRPHDSLAQAYRTQ